MPLQIRVEGVRETTAAIASISPALALELGRRNKAIGAKIIAAAVPKPTPVGAGAGAMPRPSASRNVLQIRAGGAWRKMHVQQWGARVVPDRNSTPRPYLLQAGLRLLPSIRSDWLGALVDVAHAAGLEARRG
jgi:hypothetical protein